eukprot:gene8627-9262_t
MAQVAEKLAKEGCGKLLEWLLGGAPSQRHLVAALLGIVTPLKERASVKQLHAIPVETAKAAATCIIAYLLKADEVCGKDARFLFEPEHSEGHPKVVPKCWDKKAAIERKDAKQASAGRNAEANGRGAAEHHGRAREAAAGRPGCRRPQPLRRWEESTGGQPARRAPR